jgi:3,4-dihydroxy 2-butanone 4-phosphate synthase/GTP cyclohydrolase II
MVPRARALSPILAELETHLERARVDRQRRGRPFVTLAYAQSLDGSIAVKRDRPLTLSCSSSWQLTHELRASHDAILVGIGTVLADNPRLNVRLVAGEDPQPVVVDSRLRLPLDAHLLSASAAPWVATTTSAEPRAGRRLAAAGAEVLRLPALANGWVDLPALTGALSLRGVSSLLVEGGARILTSFLRARLVDFVVLTVAPRFVGGVTAFAGGELAAFPRLAKWHSERCGEDLVLAGELDWSEPDA